MKDLQIESGKKSWDNYFIEMCDLVATKATCDRKHVGSVIIKDLRILSTGYNGSLSRTAHCSDPPFFARCPTTKLTVELTEEEYFHYQKNSIDLHRFFNKKRDISAFGKPFLFGQGGHLMEDGHCVRTVHAEINAVAQAARLGHSVNNAILYCNTLPCWPCLKVIVSSGIVEVIYRDEYRPDHLSKIKELTQSVEGFSCRRIV